ncbi:M23 family metallopeptidase [Thiofilum flexile]|uniref:M23 family metallopeptidase n=1 Tax=Thiofilum flexile TaxID=125627 RepID=UPI00036F36FD|nr:M23 family metallopeptidase [Thiofilum flexile]
MERYNLPSGGIEVIITQDHKITTRNHYDNYVTPSDKIPTINPLAHFLNASPIHHPIRYFFTRSLMMVLVLAAIGNVPVYSRLQLNTQTNLDEQIRSALQIEQELASLDEADRQAEDKAERLLELELEQYQYNTTSPDEVVMPFPLDSSDATDLATTESKVKNIPAPIFMLPKAAEYGRWNHIAITESQSLETLLKANKFEHVIPVLAKNPAIAENLKQLKAGRRVFLRAKGKELNQLIYAQDNNKAFVITRWGSQYQGEWDNIHYSAQDTELTFNIVTSLSQSAHDVGIPSTVTKQLIQIFKDEINLRNFKQGDRIALIFEDFRYKDKSIYSENLLAADIRHNHKTFQRVRFNSAGGKAHYLSPNTGAELLQQTAFNRRPLQGGQMSSGFGFRTHPVVGKWRLHKGTDFAAPSGTPIYATGAGVVKFIGRQSGYGKVIELSHEGGITTLYGHMSAFKQGLEAGSSVQRGQVIGYVGSTGRSTGNHVHYEFRQNNEALNPMTVALPKTGLLTPEERLAFNRYAARLIKRLARLQLDNDSATNNLKLTQQAN